MPFTTTLVYSANAPAGAAQNQFYTRQRQADRFRGQALQLYRRPQLLYKPATEQLRPSLQLLWQAKLLLKNRTGQIWQPGEANQTIKEQHKATDLLQIFIAAQKKLVGETQQEVARPCRVVCSQLWRPQGGSMQLGQQANCAVAPYRLRANDNTAPYTCCRPP